MRLPKVMHRTYPGTALVVPDVGCSYPWHNNWLLRLLRGALPKVLCGALRGTAWGLPRHALISSRPCSGLSQVQNQAPQVLHRTLLDTALSGFAQGLPRHCTGLPNVLYGASQGCAGLFQALPVALPGFLWRSPRHIIACPKTVSGAARCSPMCCGKLLKALLQTHPDSLHGPLPGTEPGSPMCLAGL